METLINTDAEVYEYLKLESAKGKKWVVYPADTPTNTKDLHCFSEKHDAQQYEHDFTTHFDKMVAKPISEFLAERQVEELDNSILNWRMQVEVSNMDELLPKLRILGFDDKNLKREIVRAANESFTQRPVVVTQNYLGSDHKFNLDFQMGVESSVVFLGYNGVVRPTFPPIEHGIYNHVDTSSLEKQIQELDWTKHPGNFFYSPEDRLNPEIREMWYLQKQLDKLIDSNWQAPDEVKEQAFKIWEALTVQNFSDTPLEKAITGTVPYLSASFEEWIPFSNEVKVQEACKSLIEIKNRNNLSETSKNNNHMENQNLDFLKSNLLNLGFGDKLNESLEKNMREQKAAFELNHEVPHFNNKMSYTLHFKKSDTSEMYFFNKYDAALKNGKPEENKNQSFYINKGMGVTAKESFNLLEGRSVFKDMVNKEGQKYSTWLRLDFENSDEKGNHKLKQYSEGYGYNLEKTLANYAIKELQDPEQKAQLLKSLEKGNVQQVTIKQGDKEAKYYVEAVPQFKTINAYDTKMHIVKRQSLQTAQTQNASESVAKSLKSSKGQKNDVDEAAPKKKQIRKRKLSV
jgi:hypothetical protein